MIDTNQNQNQNATTDQPDTNTADAANVGENVNTGEAKPNTGDESAGADGKQ